MATDESVPWFDGETPQPQPHSATPGRQPGRAPDRTGKPKRQRKARRSKEERRELREAKRASGRAPEHADASGAPAQTVRELTTREAAVLEVACDPAMYTATQADKAAKAQVSEHTWRKIVRDPWFANVVSTRVLTRLTDNLDRLMAAAIDSAMEVGRDGHHDRRMLFTMAGMHGGTTVRHTGTITHEHHAERLTEALTRKEAAIEASRTIEAEYTDLTEAEPG